MSKNKQLARRARDSIQNGGRPVTNRIKVARMNGKGSLIHSRYVYSPGIYIDTGNTTCAINHLVAPTQYGNDAGGAVMKNYEEYRVLRSKYIYTPAVGSTTAGVLHLAYFDNPEIIYRYNSGGYTTAQKILIVKNSPTRVSCPVWQACELVGGTRRRRPNYAVDNTTIGSVADADRAIHGMFAAVIEGAVAPDGPFTMGMMSIEYSVEGFGLQLGAQTDL